MSGAIKFRCRGPLKLDHAKVVKALLEEGRLAEAARADKAGRKGCGYDFGQIIEARPKDGKEHPYTCPKCGVTGTYTAPLAESG